MLARRMNGNMTVKFERLYWEHGVIISLLAYKHKCKENKNGPR